MLGMEVICNQQSVIGKFEKSKEGFHNPAYCLTKHRTYLLLSPIIDHRSSIIDHRSPITGLSPTGNFPPFPLK